VQLALQLWAQPARCQFLDPVADRAHQQLTAEPWRRRRLVELAPHLAKLANTERGEAQERLLGDNILSGRHRSSPLPGSLDSNKPVDGPIMGILASHHLATGFAQAGNGRAHGMRQQPSRCPISATEAPSGRSSRPISFARFVLARGCSATLTLGVGKSAHAATGLEREGDCSGWL
jgi:hypothetical protein